MKKRNRVLLAAVIGLLASFALITTAFGQAPDDAIPIFEHEGTIYYVDPDNLPDGFDPAFIASLADMSPEEREDALEAKFAEAQAADPGLDEGGSSLTGPCGGFVYSFDDNGVLIDAAMDSGTDSAPVSLMGGGQAFTEGNPFKVNNNGEVIYMGFANPAPENHKWSVSVSALGTDITVDEGSHPNEGKHNRNFGTVDLGQDFPLKLNFTVKVSGQLTSENGVDCEGSGWVEVEGENNIWVSLGAGLAALGGFAGVLFNARPARTWQGG